MVRNVEFSVTGPLVGLMMVMLVLVTLELLDLVLLLVLLTGMRVLVVWLLDLVRSVVVTDEQSHELCLGHG